MEWWEIVKVILEERRIIVFINGIYDESINEIFNGGQFRPISGVGFKDEWKNVQKNEINKNSSEIRKVINLILNPFDVVILCSPRIFSRIVSRHHWKRIKINKRDLIDNHNKFLEKMNLIKLIIKINEFSLIITGHGLTEIIWNLWENLIFWFLLIIIIYNIYIYILNKFWIN